MLLLRLWYLLFGPPRVKRGADGSLRVRLAGQVFEAGDEDGLITLVDRARSITAGRLAEARLSSSATAGYGMRGPGANGAFRMARSLEHRLGLYEEFLARLLRES